MKIFIEEIRKILRPMPLLILAAFTALYSFVVLGTSYDRFTLSGPAQYTEIIVDLTQLFGTRLKPEKFDGAVQTLSERYLKEINQRIAADPKFVGLGVTDFDSYRAMQEKIYYGSLTPEDKKYLMADDPGRGEITDQYGYQYEPYDPNRDYTLTPAEAEYQEKRRQGDTWGELGFWDIKYGYITNELPGSYSYLREGNIEEDIEWWAKGSKSAETAIRKFHDNGEMANLFPGWGYLDYTAWAFMWLAILIIATICFLLAPVLTRDNMAGIRALQYSSKTGRKTGRSQLCAMLGAAFLIALLEIAVTVAVFTLGGWKHFLGSKLNSFIMPYQYTWFEGTFAKFLLCLAGLTLLFSMAAAMFIFLLSHASKNYISLILGMVPVVGGLGYLSYVMLGNVPFAINTDMSNGHSLSWLLFPYAEVFVCGLLVLAGAAAVGIVLRRLKRAEV